MSLYSNGSFGNSKMKQSVNFNYKLIEKNLMCYKEEAVRRLIRLEVIISKEFKCIFDLIKDRP